MLLSLALGGVFGVALSIVLEWTNDTIRNADDVAAATDLVCLASFAEQRRRRTAAKGVA
jgi:capsular polysaccharide biosynthesis protein